MELHVLNLIIYIIVYIVFRKRRYTHRYRSLNLQNNLLFMVKCLKFSLQEERIKRRACIYARTGYTQIPL